MMNNLNLFKYKKKKWTVLIYADGNNDLAPEIYQGFEKIKDTSISDDINIIVQLAMAPDKLVNTLRPKVSFHSLGNKGTRRYRIHNKDATLVDDLGNVNMADPASLSDFILWGITNYPAEHIMVILSGHGAGFAGAMNDYTHDQPYIMSIKGMTRAILKCKKITKKNIDCLVLDTCYMNLVEVWYEFALISDQPVKYLISPLKNIDLKGLPCHLLINHLQEIKNDHLPIQDALTNMIKDVNQECGIFEKIMGVSLVRKNFTTLKKNIDMIASFITKNHINLISTLANSYQYKPTYPLISLLDLDNTLCTLFSDIYPNKINIRGILEDIIIYPHLNQLPENQNLGPSLYLPGDINQYLALKNYYDHLLFANNNRWLHVLQGDQKKEQDNHHKKTPPYNILPPPMPMPIGSVVAVILEQNPSFTENKAWKIVKNLGWY